jgi:hypothetical protein
LYLPNLNCAGNVRSATAQAGHDLEESFKDLRDRGIVGSRSDLHRKRKNPTFPTPVLDEGRLKWLEDEINAWASSLPRVKARPQPTNLPRQEAAAA